MKENIIKHLESLPFFSISSLQSFENIKRRALYENLQRWTKNGSLIRLKNGLYVTKTYVDRFLHENAYIEFMANTLLSPSYLSLEYVLQKNGLLTESTYTITSVTLKTTRSYQNQMGSFVYQHLHKRHYFGFVQKSYGQNHIYEATLPKALFDFLYLRLSFLDPKDISTLAELRINWSELDHASFLELQKIIRNSGVKKMQKLISYLEELYHGNSLKRP